MTPESIVSATPDWTLVQYVAAYHAIPGLGNGQTPPVAIKQALDAEPDGAHRARAWNAFAAAVFGGTEPPRSGTAMLAGYMRNARKHAPESTGQPRELTAEEEAAILAEREENERKYG